MSIQTGEENGAQVIRLLSNSVSGTDIAATRNYIEELILQGSSIFILSIEEIHKKSFVACGLIAICAEIVHANGGTLLLAVRSGRFDEEIRDLCKALNIYTYSSENTTIVESASMSTRLFHAIALP